MNDSTTAAPTCTRHPERETGLRCTRCARPWCWECLTPAPVGAQCRECMRAAEPQPRAATFPKPTQFLPKSATAALMALCVAGFAAQTFLQPRPPALPLEIRFGFIAVPVWGGELYRLLTSQFLHADLLHLAMNLWGLWWFGTPLERERGPAVVTLAFLGTGVAGGAASYLFLDPTTVSIGASGGVFGLLGFHLVWSRAARSAVQQDLVFLGVNLVLGFLSPGINLVAHAGGFLAGLAYGGLDAVVIARTPEWTKRSRALAAVTLTVLVVAATVALTRTIIRGG